MDELICDCCGKEIEYGKEYYDKETDTCYCLGCYSSRADQADMYNDELNQK